MPVPHYVQYNTRTGEIIEGLGNLSRRRFVPDIAQSIDLSDWERIGNREYAVHKKVGTPGRENTIFRDRDGNYYIARRDQKGNLSKPVLVKDSEMLKELLTNPTEERLNIFYDELAKSPAKKARQAKVAELRIDP
jgi:hypothetical protein